MDIQTKKELIQSRKGCRYLASVVWSDYSHMLYKLGEFKTELTTLKSAHYANDPLAKCKKFFLGRIIERIGEMEKAIASQLEMIAEKGSMEWKWWKFDFAGYNMSETDAFALLLYRPYQFKRALHHLEHGYASVKKVLDINSNRNQSAIYGRWVDAASMIDLAISGNDFYFASGAYEVFSDKAAWVRMCYWALPIEVFSNLSEAVDQEWARVLIERIVATHTDVVFKEESLYQLESVSMKEEDEIVGFGFPDIDKMFLFDQSGLSFREVEPEASKAKEESDRPNYFEDKEPTYVAPGSTPTTYVGTGGGYSGGKHEDDPYFDDHS